MIFFCFIIDLFSFINKSIITISYLSFSSKFWFFLIANKLLFFFLIILFSINISSSIVLSSSFQNLSKLVKIDNKKESTSLNSINEWKYNLYIVSIFSLLLKQVMIIVFSKFLIWELETNSS